MLSWPPSRRALVGVLAVVLLVGVAGVALAGRRGTEAQARETAERYLRVLADESADPSELDELLAPTDADEWALAGALLAEASSRISDVTLGDSREVSTARSTVPSDLVFDGFEEFEVRYHLAGERHRATITLGRSRGGSGGEASRWLVVTPLAGSVDWNGATWLSTPLDVTVGDVPVTVPGQTTYEPAGLRLHPAVYPARGGIAPWFASPPEQVVVVAGSAVSPAPALRPAATEEGVAALTQAALAAFDRCEDGTAYCPIADLVYPAGDDRLPEGWWHGFTTTPTVTVDGTTVRLADGAFRYLSPSGPRTVRFTGSTQVTIDPDRRPAVADRWRIERQP
ncbi:hypothetical protein [Nocardioides sp. SLBN-35]|uniref:hypothetical protein n=1 Tax=Nocardioides sp. SLBN-35 TaxID=2768445 RepID=UPI00115231A8|nr:hypothetical protein [Nocardioides sp. SLBN-35]TQK69229.1 hypothetical protein FBY23_0990 [Nocardioides sp. SLBN-35]